MAPNGVQGTGPVFGAHPNVSGSVRVDVHLHGAPPGTTVTASGPVAAPPPRIETSVPLAR